MLQHLRKIKFFYEREFYRICSKVNRNKTFSIMLLLISQSQIYYILSNPFIAEFRQHQSPLQIFNYFFENIIFNFQIQSAELYSDIFIILILVKQSLFMVSLAIFFYQYSKQIRFGKDEIMQSIISFEKEVIIQFNKEQDFHQKWIFLIIFRTLLVFQFKSLFLYLLLSSKLLSNQQYFYKIKIMQKYKLCKEQNLEQYEIFIIVAAMMVFIINNLLYHLCEEHNYQFSFKRVDFLSQIYTFKARLQSIMVELLTIIVIFLQNYEISLFTIQSVILSFLTVIIILIYNYPRYQESIIHQIQFQSFAFFLFNSLIIILFAQIIDLDFSLIIFFFIPLLYKISKQLILRQNEKIILITYHNDYFDDQMMKIYDQCYQTLSNNGILINEANYRLPKNLNLYSFSTNHLGQCKISKQQECFCWTYKSQGSYFISRSQYKTFVKDLIRFHYEQKLKQKQKQFSLQTTVTYFFYILYLSKVIKQPTKAFYELILIKNEMYDQLSWISKMFFHSVENLVKADFLRMTQIKNITNQKYNCQLVFNYHEAIKLWKVDFFSSVKNLRSWYQLLQMREFGKLLTLGLVQLEKNQALENNLKHLFRLNPFSPECSLLITLFYKYIHFNNKKLEIPSNDSAISLKFQSSVKGILFHKDAAFVYLTLLGQKGIIKNYTKTFRDALQTTDSNIMNQSINNFIPAIIARVHDQYLDNFVERGRINIMKSEHRFLLVKNFQGFIFPIIAKVKLETDLENDFGSSALILPTYSNFHYILLNSYGLIEEISEKLYEQLILKILKVQIEEIYKVDCLKLIPKLLKSWKNIFIQQKLEPELKEVSETYLIVPKKEKKQSMIFQYPTKDQKELDYFQHQDKVNEMYFAKLRNMYMFKVQMRVVEFQTFRGPIYCVELQTIKPVRSMYRQEIFSRLLGKADLPFLTKNKIKTIIDEKKHKQTKQNGTQQRETYGFIPLIADHQTFTNLDTQKLIEDDYMILLKEQQIQSTNPKYNNEQLSVRVSENNFEKKDQNLKMKSSIGQNNLVSFNQFNSSLSNVFSSHFQDQRLLVHSSVILEGLNDNKESVKSQSIDGLGSQDNFLSEMDQIQSMSSSQVSDLRVKKSKIRNNLLQMKSIQNKVIRYINLIFFILLIILNSLYFYFFIFENQVFLQINQIIQQAFEQYKFISDINTRFNLFILSFNQSNTKNFNFESYQDYSANEFQDDIKSIQFYAESLNQKKIQYLQVSDIESLFNLSLFYSLSYFSSYFLYSTHQNESNFLELIARNYITINEESKVLNYTVIHENYVNFQNSGSNILAMFSLVITFLLLMHGFYFFILTKIHLMKLKLSQLFATISKPQVNCLIESLQVIIRYFETFDFVNETTREIQIEQIKMKITQSPGMIKLRQPNKVVRPKFAKQESKSKIIYLLYFMIQVISFLLISSQYFGSLIYQNQFQQDTIDYFKQFFIYKSTQILLLDFQQNMSKLENLKFFSKAIVRYLFLKQGNQSILYMNKEIETLNLFIKRLNDQKNFPNQIFSDTIKVDACQSLKLYPSSFENTFFSETICQNIGALNQGLTIQTANFYQNFLQFFTLYDQNVNQFKKYLSSNMTNESQIELYENTIYTSFVLNQLYTCIADISNQDFTNNIIIHSVLYSFGTILYITLLIISNKKLDSYLYNQIIKTKQIFFLIPIEYLCESEQILLYMANSKSQELNA